MPYHISQQIKADILRRIEVPLPPSREEIITKLLAAGVPTEEPHIGLLDLFKRNTWRRIIESDYSWARVCHPERTYATNWELEVTQIFGNRCSGNLRLAGITINLMNEHTAEWAVRNAFSEVCWSYRKHGFEVELPYEPVTIPTSMLRAWNILGGNVLVGETDVTHFSPQEYNATLERILRDVRGLQSTECAHNS